MEMGGACMAFSKFGFSKREWRELANGALKNSCNWFIGGTPAPGAITVSLRENDLGPSCNEVNLLRSNTLSMILVVHRNIPDGICALP